MMGGVEGVEYEYIGRLVETFTVFLKEFGSGPENSLFPHFASLTRKVGTPKYQNTLLSFTLTLLTHGLTFKKGFFPGGCRPDKGRLRMLSNSGAGQNHLPSLAMRRCKGLRERVNYS